MFKWLKNFIFGTSTPAQGIQPRPLPNERIGVNTPMNEGDVHSGPRGYTPNTAYPETEYGSGFNEDAAWHDGEN